MHSASKVWDKNVIMFEVTFGLYGAPMPMVVQLIFLASELSNYETIWHIPDRIFKGTCFIWMFWKNVKMLKMRTVT